jgi:hypothetical protein
MTDMDGAGMGKHTRAVAWLVEIRADGRCGGWIQADPVDGMGWTLDPHKAIRFARQIDADWFRQRYGFVSTSPSHTHLSTEHVFLPAMSDEDDPEDWATVPTIQRDAPRAP